MALQMQLEAVKAGRLPEEYYEDIMEYGGEYGEEDYYSESEEDEMDIPVHLPDTKRRFSEVAHQMVS